ncbi:MULTISPECIES: hypothetical protein [Bacillus amyloliquefaciens group]|uniref:hypothetical protein n=1 Tax=Bacillus amyloliquefaciens group TaxID=1938374 RepID=UPI0021505DF9|nr:MULTISPECIES: hypothetical protein [Bacillus amyloliquefaciens group]MCR4368194.1 hypothetical protein [Bacillus amyloliquefaciens]MCV3201746.1 hypothetical protein [Bacillus velezensis]
MMKNVFKSSGASLEETANIFKVLANTSVPTPGEWETYYKEKERKLHEFRTKLNLLELKYDMTVVSEGNDVAIKFDGDLYDRH